MHEYLFYHCTYVFHLFLFFLSSFFIVYIYYFILCSIEKNSNEKKCTRTKGKFIYFIRDRSYELILTPRSLVRLSEIVVKNIYIYSYIFAYWICEYRPDVHSARLSTWSHGRIETIRFIIYHEDTYSLVNKCL